jgi:hypothetical protein
MDFNGGTVEHEDWTANTDGVFCAKEIRNKESEGVGFASDCDRCCREKGWDP